MIPQFSHTLKGNGKTYTFNIGGAGCEKKITREPIYLDKDSIKIFGFGQDSLGILKTESQLLLSLADGHGIQLYGKTISYIIHQYMLPLIAKEEDVIIELIKKNDKKNVDKLISSIFNDVNKIILYQDEITSKFNQGGTTFTLVHKIIDKEDGTLYSLTYNVGDSPHFKISLNGEIEEISVDHNCDNMEQVQEYYNYCLENELEPSMVILGRFNMPKFYKTPWIGDKPVNPYIANLVNNKYKLESNYIDMKKFYELAPPSLKDNTIYNGGPQSIRGREKNLEKIKSGEFPMENFGSTLEGSLQNFNSFGDKKDILNHNIMCKPSINISKITDSHYDFIGSDGPVDCLTNETILYIFKQKPSMNMEEFTEFITHTIDTNAIKGGFRLSSFTNVPTWDDNSFWAVETIVENEPIDSLVNKIVGKAIQNVIDNECEIKIQELEEEYKMMLKFSEEIETQIRKINSIIDNL